MKNKGPSDLTVFTLHPEMLHAQNDDNSCNKKWLWQYYCMYVLLKIFNKNYTV